MTTGYVLTDHRQNVLTSSGAYKPAGEVFWRSWSGTDRAYPGDLTPHNYTMTSSDHYESLMAYHPFPNDLSYVYYSLVTDLFGGAPLPDLNWSDNDTLKIAVKLGEKIRTTDFNAAIFLAEADQSLKLIGDSATRLAKFFNALKTGHIHKAASFLANGHMYDDFVFTLKKHFKHKSAFEDRRVLADAILEVQYGWRPLLADAAGAGEALASILSRPTKSTYSATRQLQGNLVTILEDGRHRWVSRKTISKKLTAVVSAPPTWRSQLRLSNYAQAITNRTPWAFVANWFIPFEDYLEARNTFTDLNISSLLLTTKQKSMGQFTSVDGGEAFHKMFTFKREVQPISTSGPTIFANSFLPLPSVKPIEKSLGWEHVLNGIALLNGVEKRYRD